MFCKFIRFIGQSLRRFAADETPHLFASFRLVSGQAWTSNHDYRTDGNLDLSR